jgi:four helix bundle protein
MNTSSSTNKKISRFEELPVWSDALEFAVLIYSTTKSFPKDEKYGIISQMRRASSSISANIAEGFGRKSPKDTAHFYKIALGSLLETKNFIYLSSRLGYIDTYQEAQLLSSCQQMQNQISAILKYFKKHE